MNGELLNVLDYIEREKGIKREVLIKAVESSLLLASKKSIGSARNASIVIDPQTGHIKVFKKFLVVKEVKNAQEEITLKKAKQHQANAKIGDEVSLEITPENFGRIAAQTAKQVIVQKLREAEKDIIFAEYRDRIGDLVNGIIRRIERGNIIVDLGKSEAILTQREQSPVEKYSIGSRIRTLIVDVKYDAKFPMILLSRTHPDFLKKMFELEVPEIADGIVEIKSIAREAGYRSKIAVFSSAEKVDCVGACVGMRGERVKNVVRELNGEKIDIVRWDEDQAVYIANALSPAKLKKVQVLQTEKRVSVIVEEDQLSLAIGKKGQNARLCAKLTGWRIDISTQRMPTAREEDKAGEEPTKPQIEKVFTTSENVPEAPVKHEEDVENKTEIDPKDQ
ncbi:MAG: transcription termination factor NusA [Chlamydiota bacterium]|nr:transcription termination factor NusA [Chlamydiota bacterium]